MAQIRSSRWWIGLTAILASAFAGLLAVLVFANWPEPADDGPDPTVFVTASPGSTEIVHPVPLDAWPVTESVLDAVTEDWILVEYDSSAGRFGPPLVAVDPPDGPTPTASPSWVPGTGAPEWEIQGNRYFYIVDPSGAVFEAADLGDSSDMRLAAWLPDRRTVIVTTPLSGGVALRSFDLLTRELSDRFPGPGGASNGLWRDPEVSVSTDGEGLVVVFGTTESTKGITRIEFNGTPIETPVAPSVFGGYVQSSDGAILIVVEGDTESEQGFVSYAAPGTSILPEPSPAATATPQPPPAASPAPSPSPMTAEGYERYTHGLPPGEEDCWPASWPEDRQLLVACLHEDGSMVIFTLALMTSTFVDVTIVPFVEGEPYLSFGPGGTRISRGTFVINSLGDTVWSLPAGEPVPAGLAWAGDLLISWGDADRTPKPGYGVSAIAAYHSSQGELAYVLEAIRGAAGFGTVVAAPPGEDEA